MRAAGGVAGIGLGLAGLDYFTPERQEVAKMAWHHGLGAVSLGAFLSGAFAVIPAYQAARLDPIEALKAE